MKLLYLSGAPSVSTRTNSESGGARSHVLGIISGFKDLNWEVDEYIVGDLGKQRTITDSHKKQMSKNILFRILGDIIRIYLGLYNSYKSFKKFKNHKIVYERLGAFQCLGNRFKKNGAFWILETNSLLYFEANKDRKSIFFVGICKYFERLAYSNSDLIICVTDELKQMVVDAFKINPEKILVIPNGVDTIRFKPEYTEKDDVKKDFITIGFVGVLLEWCGLNTLIEAIENLQSEERYKIVVVGDGNFREHFENMVQEKNISHLFEFKGRQSWDDIPSFIETFDICYSGQIHTKFGKMYHSPLKIYEYLSMGKPVLASRFQDASNVITDGENGFCFESGNVTELIEKIKLTSKMIKENKIDSSKIRGKIISQHSWKSRVQTLIKRVNETNSKK